MVLTVFGYVHLPPCVCRAFAVLLPVYNWCCAGNFHICKLPVSTQTRAHTNRKSTKTRHFHGREGRTPPDFKVRNALFLWALPLPAYLPSYLLLLSSFPHPSPISFDLFYVPCPLLPLFTPPPAHHSIHSFLLGTPFLPFLLPHSMFLSNIY